MEINEPPIFSGENPELWISKMEQWMFDYQIPDEHEIEFSLQYIEGNAQLWGQEKRELISDMNWCDFVYYLLWEFDKGKGNTFEGIADVPSVKLVKLVEEEASSRSSTHGNIESERILGAHDSENYEEFMRRGSINVFDDTMQNSESLILPVDGKAYQDDEVVEGNNIMVSASLDFMADIDVPIAWCLHSMNDWAEVVNLFYHTAGESVYSVCLQEVSRNALSTQPESKVVLANFQSSLAEICNLYGESDGYSYAKPANYHSVGHFLSAISRFGGNVIRFEVIHILRLLLYHFLECTQLNVELKWLMAIHNHIPLRGQENRQAAKKNCALCNIIVHLTEGLSKQLVYQGSVLGVLLCALHTVGLAAVKVVSNVQRILGIGKSVEKTCTLGSKVEKGKHVHLNSGYYVCATLHLIFSWDLGAFHISNYMSLGGGVKATLEFLNTTAHGVMVGGLLLGVEKASDAFAVALLPSGRGLVLDSFQGMYSNLHW